MSQSYNLIVILGPTATGKTELAAHLSHKLDTEIISADSRQVYRGMDIGTGKDYEDYKLTGLPGQHDKKMPVHLLDIADAGYHYNVYEYQKDFFRVFSELRDRGKIPVLCGGTGLYIEAVLKGYRLIKVPDNQQLRSGLEDKSMDELAEILSSFKRLHNTTDLKHRKRLIRAIEIETYYTQHPETADDLPVIDPVIFGNGISREKRRERISLRLKKRMEEGMIEEVKALIKSGVKKETLVYYGLEYKYITYYLDGELSYEEMFGQLETAIHRFAKRQMTWFRGMEKRGITVHWLDALAPMEEKLDFILSKISL